jgi:hypothetical protein
MEQLTAPAADLRDDAVIFPASFAQQRMWFLDQLEPGNPAYHIPLLYALRGELNVAALSAALDQIAARHETLRTTFAFHEGDVIQVIAPALPVRLELHDLCALPEPARRRWRTSSPNTS